MLVTACAIVVGGSLGRTVFPCKVTFMTGNAVWRSEGPGNGVAAAGVAVITGEGLPVLWVVGTTVGKSGRQPGRGVVADVA